MHWSFKNILVAVIAGKSISALLLTLLGAWNEPVYALGVAIVAPTLVILIALQILVPTQTHSASVSADEANPERTTQKIPIEDADVEGITGALDSATTVLDRQIPSPSHHSSDLHLHLKTEGPEDSKVVNDRATKLEFLYNSLKRIPGVLVYHSNNDAFLVYGSSRNMIGFSVEEINEMAGGLEERMHPEDRKKDAKAEDAWRKSGCKDVLVRRSRFQHRDGHWIWLEDRMVGEIDEEGKNASITGVTINVTKEVEAMSRADEAFQRSELAISATGIGIWEHDIKRNKIHQDDTNLNSLMVERNEDSSSLEFWRSQTHPEDRKVVDGHYEAMLSGERDGYESTVRVKRGDGEYVHLHTLAQVLERDEEGNALKVIGISRDVSENLARERQLREAQKLESLGLLAGGIAHDFNNYLGAILGYSALALATIDKEAGAFRHIESAVKGAERAADLTKQLLAYSGRGSFYVEPLSVAEIVESISSLMLVSISKKVQLEIKVKPELAPIMGDRSQIQQVVLNLITNAADAIGDNEGKLLVTLDEVEPNSSERLSWRLPSASDKNRFIHLEVKDSGEGMSPETLNRLFEPFFTTKSDGHGLGLAAITGILNTHRGGANILSEAGKGTTFHIYLPASENSETSTTHASAQQESASQEKAPLLVLAVDDDPGIREFLGDFLTSSGHRVDLAENGQQALDTIGHHPDRYDLIIMDLTMPVLDGAAAAASIQEIAPSLPIILSSGYSEVDSITELMKQPNLHFLQKPYLPERMNRKIDDAISGAKA